MNNISLTELPKSDPAVALRFRDRQYAADLIGAAILEFDLFSYLKANQPVSFQQIIDHFGAVLPAHRRFADLA